MRVDRDGRGAGGYRMALLVWIGLGETGEAIVASKGASIGYWLGMVKKIVSGH